MLTQSSDEYRTTPLLNLNQNFELFVRVMASHKAFQNQQPVLTLSFKKNQFFNDDKLDVIKQTVNGGFKEKTPIHMIINERKNEKN